MNITGYLDEAYNEENTKKIIITVLPSEIDKIKKRWGDFTMPIFNGYVIINLKSEKNFTGLFNQKKIFHCKIQKYFLPEKNKWYKKLVLDYMESPTI